MGPAATLWTAAGSLVRFDDTSPGEPAVTLQAGEVILEVHRPVAGTQFRVRTGEQVVEFGREGIYRFGPSLVRVYAGEANVAGTKLLRGQEWGAGAARTFNRKERDPFFYFAAYRSFQLESESGTFRLWHATDFTQREHSGFGIDFPQSSGSARVKYLAGGEAGLVYHLEGSAVTGGKSPVNTNRLPFRLGEENYLRTDVGKAEVFLGVGMVARMAEHTQLRMMDTQSLRPMIALDQGSAVIEVTKSSDGPHLRVRVGESITTLDKPGVYQFDAQEGSLRIYGGQANAMISDRGMTLREGQKVNLRQAGAANFNTQVRDALFQWSADRSFQLYLGSAAFMTGWEPMTEPGKVRHKIFGQRVDRRPQPRRRRLSAIPPI
jgi:hypothetical protein